MRSNEFNLNQKGIGGHLADDPEFTSPLTLGSLGSNTQKDNLEEMRNSLDMIGGGFNNLD